MDNIYEFDVNLGDNVYIQDYENSLKRFKQ